MKTHVVLINGKKKIFITNIATGVDRRKEAADVVCGNTK